VGGRLDGVGVGDERKGGGGARCIQSTTHSRIFRGVGGVCIVLELDQTTRRDRARVFAQFEIPRQVRGTSSIQEKRLVEGEASNSIIVSIL
jgi:hypothetical protein